MVETPTPVEEDKPNTVEEVQADKKEDEQPSTVAEEEGVTTDIAEQESLKPAEDQTVEPLKDDLPMEVAEESKAVEEEVLSKSTDEEDTVKVDTIEEKVRSALASMTDQVDDRYRFFLANRKC